MRHLPDEQREEREHERHGECLGAELQPRGHRDPYADTMKTVVPILTRLKSHSASEMCIRMQPCEAE